MASNKTWSSPLSASTFGPVCQKWHFHWQWSDHKRQGRTWPPPMAYPLTMTRLGNSRIFCVNHTFKLGTPSSPIYPPIPLTFWSHHCKSFISACKKNDVNIINAFKFRWSRYLRGWSGAKCIETSGLIVLSNSFRFQTRCRAGFYGFQTGLYIQFFTKMDLIWMFT